MCLNDEEKGQIGGLNVVGEAGEDGNGGSTAQSAAGLRGTPPSAIVHAGPGSSGECRLKALEEENVRLKKLLAEQMLDAAALRELVSKKW